MCVKEKGLANFSTSGSESTYGTLEVAGMYSQTTPPNDPPNLIYYNTMFLCGYMKRVFQDVTNISGKNIRLVVKKTGSRKKLLRWLYEVVLDFKYSHITYARAVYIIDMFVWKRGLDVSTYQLLGVAALFISAKMEESTVMKTKEYSAVTDFSCDVKEILRMERSILVLLDYNLYFLLPHYYVTEKVLVALDADLGLRDKRMLFYSVISYVLESEEASGNVFGIFKKSRDAINEMLHASWVKDGMKLYFGRNTAIEAVFSTMRCSELMKKTH